MQLSTPHGGHINRTINASESLVELDSVLYKYRKRLRPANVGAASMKLEHLYRYELSTPYGHRVRRMAAELQKYVETYTERLALTQVANVVRGLSSVGHRLPSELLVRLAAGVLVNEGVALRLAPDVDVRDLFYGFSGQGYTNPLFWSRASAAVLPRLPTFNPNTLPALALALQAANQLPESAAAVPPPSGVSAPTALAREALRLLLGSLERLQPARLADTAQLLVRVGPQLGVALDEEQRGKLQAAALLSLPSLAAHPNQLATLLLSVQQLQPRSLPGSQPQPLPADLLAGALPVLHAAAPSMQLLHIKRAVQALAPSAASADDTALPALINMLARRAATLLPGGAATAGSDDAAALAPQSVGSSRPRLPRGGKGVGVVLAAVAGSAPHLLEASELGVVLGLGHAFRVAVGAPAAGGNEVTAGIAGPELGARYGDVQELMTRVAALALAGREMGLLQGQKAALSA